ncbi:MAG: flagellar capping protein [Lachnospiraceae bacterium]|nr:flagellar capping protein [Lachnospiraceae bacterium]
MADITALNTVYNHFMTTYAPNGTNSRYDTHKKSELRGVYNSIVKMNKESPLFLLDTSDEAKEFAVGIKEGSRELKNVISSLSAGGDELLSKKSVSSSNPDIATATYIGSAGEEDQAPSFDIEVKQLATAQENTGKFLSPDEMSLKPDTYSFDIRSRDLDYEFQFNINENDTNRSIEEKLTRLVNKSNIGLTASVIEDNAGRIALKLESVETGASVEGKPLFIVSDDKTSKAAGAVSYFGLDQTTQANSNSIFLLNGEERSTYANQFTIEKTYELHLNGVSKEGEKTSIGLKTDVESLTENVSHLIEGYNSFLNKAAAYLDKQPQTNKLLGEMNSISTLYENELESIGVNIAEDGRMTLDKNLLQQTAQEEDAAARFASMQNFARNVLNKTNQISLNPMAYTEKTVVAYKNPGRNFATPYVTSNYSGMMFSSYC